MSFKILGRTKDIRSNANVIYCQASIPKYLEIVGDGFADFNIQRKRENHKAYKRLKADLKDGALIPSITLAVRHHLVDQYLDIIDKNNLLEEQLSNSNSVDILDGLQRTFILKDLQAEGVSFQDEQTVLLEFWLEKSLSKLIYRMIVLNSGQKPMSMKHQIDLLFQSLQQTIQEEVPNIQLLIEKESSRRTQHNKYHLSSVAASYHSFITSSHETDKENIIAQKLLNDDALDSSEEELTEKFNSFLGYFKEYVNIDKLCWQKYSTLNVDDEIQQVNENDQFTNEEKETKIERLNNLKNAHSWFGSENFMLAYFTAVSQFCKHPQKKDRVDTAIQKLIQSIQIDNDPLGISSFEKIRKGINPRKTNIGYATRKLITTGLKEYFRDEGETTLKDCWILSVE